MLDVILPSRRVCSIVQRNALLISLLPLFFLAPADNTAAADSLCFGMLEVAVVG